MQALNLIIFLLYIFWGAISFFAQGDTSLKEKIKAFDVLNIIPNYKFFCPRPICNDYHLHYRPHWPNGDPGDWKEVEIGRRNLLIGFLWNPTKRDRKIFYKMVRYLRQEDPQKSMRRRNNVFYKALKNYIRHQSGFPNNVPIQIQITSTQDLNPAPVKKIVYEATI